MKEMDLLKYKDIIASALSGGNKRKLSTALATLGTFISLKILRFLFKITVFVI